MKTPVEFLVNAFGQLEYLKAKEIKQALELEKKERLKRQLFIGKVSEIIGSEKTIELLKECNHEMESNI
jgi:hypothetical protein